MIGKEEEEGSYRLKLTGLVQKTWNRRLKILLKDILNVYTIKGIEIQEFNCMDGCKGEINLKTLKTSKF